MALSKTVAAGSTDSFDDGALGRVVLTGGLAVNAVSVEQRGELGRRIYLGELSLEDMVNDESVGE